MARGRSWRATVAAMAIGLFGSPGSTAERCLALAFPGADGAGAEASGGRGGRVVQVDNLNDSGVGSFRSAIESTGTRTVVFRVAGTIRLQSPLRITHGNLTIAGQTAPGGGICLRDYGLTIDGAENVILRFLRFRPGDQGDLVLGQTDALSGARCRNVIIDHCSASWSTDECLSFYLSRNISVQWCLIAESLHASIHHKGDHGYGGIWGGNNASFHHNLLAHHTSRNPRFSRRCKNVDHRNNVIYNWGFNSAYGGEHATVNFVNNYFKPGPATSKKCRSRLLDGSGIGGRWFVEGNYLHEDPQVTATNWNGVHRRYAPLDQMRATVPFPSALDHTDTAQRAYELVLQGAGATLPQRDSFDARIVREVRAGAATYGQSTKEGPNGIVNSPRDSGGWPELASAPAPPDGDHDGMPDAWEQEFGLDEADAADGPSDLDHDGFTNLEEFLNGTNPWRVE